MWGIKAHNTLKLKIMPSEARLKNFEIYKNKHTFYVNNHSPNIFRVSKFFPVSEQNSLSGKSKNQIPCFPCAMATLLGGGLQAQIQGVCVSRPTPGGGLQAHTQGGFQAHTRRGIPACTEADTPRQTATAACGTHPTGMHSC